MSMTMNQRRELRESLLNNEEHAEFCRLHDSVPANKFWGLRHELAKRGKYKNWIIDRRNGWARIRPADLVWMRGFVAEVSLSEAAEVEQTPEQKAEASDLVKTHRALAMLQNAVDDMCGTCIGIPVSNIKAQCPDSICSLRPVSKAPLAGNAFTKEPINADVAFAHTTRKRLAAPIESEDAYAVD
jgi:hypothetical protein